MCGRLFRQGGAQNVSVLIRRFAVLGRFRAIGESAKAVDSGLLEQTVQGVPDQKKR